MVGMSMLVAALALLMGAWPASGTVVYTQVNAVVEVPNNSPELETPFDFDGDGLSDIDFFTNQNGSSARGAGPGSGNSDSWILGRWQDDGGPAFQAIRNLAPGTVISDALEIGDGTQIGDETFETADGALVYKSTFGGPQDFVDGTAGIIAAKLQIPGAGTTHFAWVRVLVEKDGVRIGIPPNDDPGSRLTIIDAAYESEELVPIEAGQTSDITPVDFVEVLITNDVTALEFDSQLGVDYQLQLTEDLVVTNWVSAGFWVTGNGTNMLMYDPVGFSTGKAYRIVQ